MMPRRLATRLGALALALASALPARADFLVPPATLQQLTAPGATLDLDGLRYSDFRLTNVERIDPARVVASESGFAEFSPRVTLGAGESAGYVLQFVVAPIDPSRRIIGASLALVAGNERNTSSARLTRAVIRREDPQVQLALLDTFAGPGAAFRFVDEASFAPQESLVVFDALVAVVPAGESGSLVLAGYSGGFQLSSLGATPIPEPSSLALCGVALAGLGAWARRRAVT